MIIVLVGKSSSGKDTLMKELVKSSLFQSTISTTSRPIREKEFNAVDYNFITKEEFLYKIDNNDFIEYRSYDTELNSNKETWFYGTEKKSINLYSNSVLVLDVQGLKDIKKYFPEETIIGIYLQCSSALRTERAKSRGSFCEIEWNRRIEADKIDFRNVYAEVDYVLNSAHAIDELAIEVQEILKDYL